MHHTRIGLLIIFLLLSACSSVDSTKVFDQEQAAKLLHQSRTTQPTRQMIKIALPKKHAWQQIDMSYGTVGTPTMLIPANETVSDWKQSIRTSVFAYTNDHDATAYKMVQDKIMAAKQDCERANGEIISLNSRQATYRITMSCCHDERNQLQIGKAMMGEDAVYMVYYSVIPGQVSDAEVKKFSQIIQSAQLVRDPRYGPR